MTAWLASLSADEFMAVAVIAGFVGQVVLRGFALVALLIAFVLVDGEES